MYINSNNKWCKIIFLHFQIWTVFHSHINPYFSNPWNLITPPPPLPPCIISRFHHYHMVPLSLSPLPNCTTTYHIATTTSFHQWIEYEFFLSITPLLSFFPFNYINDPLSYHYTEGRPWPLGPIRRFDGTRPITKRGLIFL